MSQSQQDDRFDDLELFAERSYVILTQAAKQRRLNEIELYLLGHAAKVSEQLTA